MQSTQRPTGAEMVLEQAWKTFERELPQLLQGEANRGKFVLIHRDRVDSLWACEKEALAEGYQRFGVEPFLVQEVTDQKQPRYFSRNVVPCRS